MTLFNSLLSQIDRVQIQIEGLLARTRQFYYAVMLSNCLCPACRGPIGMSGTGTGRCTSCGQSCDLTVTFQRSPCCNARLRLRKAHYACCACGKAVASRFLFDERVYDRDYFREKMRQSRETARRKSEEVLALSAFSRSADLNPEKTPELDTIPGLVDALEQLVAVGLPMRLKTFQEGEAFDFDAYREMVMARVEEAVIRFSALPSLCADDRQDRVRRFMTLVFLEHEREVDLTQYGNDLLVAKHEAYGEG